MEPNPVSITTIWIIAIVVLVACWPIAQALRHEKLHPLAAYLLFTSVLGLVAAPIFGLLLVGAGAFIGPAGLEHPATAVVIVILSLLPAFAAARWIVRRPQERRMPK